MTERTLLFTDVVDSTRTAEELGEARAATLWTEHDRRARRLLSLYRGLEIGRGDGLFLVFDAATDAVGYALAYHALLAELGLSARCGIHVGHVSLRENPPDEVAKGAPRVDAQGLATPIAARVMALAGGGRTLLTAAAARAVEETLPDGVEACSRGHYQLKGIEAPMEIFELGSHGAVAFDPPADTDKAYRVARSGDLWLPARAVPHNLPAERDVFVGRKSELHALAARLDAGARVLTVIGTGGTGKTRLVSRYAWTRLGDWPGGVYFCDLSEARDAEGIFSAVAIALDVPLDKGEPGALLGNAIRSRGRCLLILDNFEQVVEHAHATVGPWLGRAEKASFVVTSRARLRISGEELFALEPLPVASDGLELFALRARAQRRDFVLDAATRLIAEQIVHLLDGLPLAIELAAARVSLLGVAGVRERLDERFRLLAGGVRAGPRRQQTLREAIDWSYSLLGPEERAAFRRAGVFAGSFSLAAARRVLPNETDDEWAVLERIGGLVDKSLVVAEASDPPRYRLLESMRAYALEKLREAEETNATQRRLALMMRDEVEREFEQGWDVPFDKLHERWMPDVDNLRAALDWTHAAGEAELEIALAGASRWIWLGAGVVEGRRRCKQALERIDPAIPAALEARLQLSWWALSLPSAADGPFRAVERAVALYREIGEPLPLCEALVRLVQASLTRGDLSTSDRAVKEAEELVDPRWPLAMRWRLLGVKGRLAFAHGHLDEAHALAREELAMARFDGDHALINASLEFFQQLAAAQGNFEEAAAVGEKIVSSMRRARFPAHIGKALGLLSEALERLGRLEEALAAAREAAEHLVAQEQVWIWLDAFAFLASRRGLPAAAALALGRADLTRTEHETPRNEREQTQRDELLNSLRVALGEVELKRLLAQGAALSDAEAARLALED